MRLRASEESLMQRAAPLLCLEIKYNRYDGLCCASSQVTCFDDRCSNVLKQAATVLFPFTIFFLPVSFDAM